MGYTETATGADKLIKRKGQTGVLSRLVTGTYDPATGTSSGDTTLTQSVSVVLLPASGNKIDSLDRKFNIDGNMESTNFAEMSPLKTDGNALDFEPEPADILTLGSEVWFVNGSTPTNPAGTPVLYELALRRG